jgi:hypothetical protein
MRNLSLFSAALILCAGCCFGQTEERAGASSTPDAPLPSPTTIPSGSSSLPKFGMALSASTLGIGIQAATAVSRTENVRVAGNYFSYSDTVSKDGIAYNGTLKLKSGEVLFDQYIGKVFHVSPGLMFYDGNQGTANATVPAGQSFSLGSATYYADSVNPAAGTGQISARKVAPEFLIGFGNLLPRGKTRVTVNFELGVVYQGSPRATLNLSGDACAGPGSGCQNIGSTPAIQANVLSEQNKINNSLSVFKYYPVVRLSFGYRF